MNKYFTDLSKTLKLKRITSALKKKPLKGCLYFPAPSPLIGPRLWPWSLAPAPGPGPQFVFTGPGPHLVFNGPGPQFVFTGPGPEFVFTGPGSHLVFTPNLYLPVHSDV